LPHRTILFLLVFLTCIAGCDAPEKGRREAETRYIGKKLPAQESWNLTLTVSDSGRRVAVIRAGHAAEFHLGKQKEQYIDNGITVEFFNRTDTLATRMTAGRAVIHSNQDIEAFNNVVIRSGSDATVIRTEYIKRTSADRMLRSDKYVTVTKPDETIRGYGFESDENLKRYKIFQASGEAVSK
jgi:LPS export ABC transporter protein LptC